MQKLRRFWNGASAVTLAAIMGAVTLLVVASGLDGLAALLMIAFFISPAMVGALLRRMSPFEPVRMHWSDYEIVRCYGYLGAASLVFTALLLNERNEAVGMLPVMCLLLRRIQRHEDAQQRRRCRACERRRTYGSDRYEYVPERLRDAAPAEVVCSVSE